MEHFQTLPQIEPERCPLFSIIYFNLVSLSARQQIDKDMRS